MRRLSYLAAAVALLAVAVLAAGFQNARADPVVRRANVALPGWPAGARPVTIALLADIHMENAAMDEARLARIVGQVNVLRPDLVVIAGDFVAGSGAEEARRAVPILACVLAGLRAPLGVVAVPGNHDHWTDLPGLRAALARVGIVMLVNDAMEAGPLAIGGLDDLWTHQERLRPTLAALARLRGAGVMVSHSPDIAPRLPPDITLLLAGHTHCGQVVLPFVGAPIEVAAPRYRCGLVREGTRTVIVTGGLGTSNVPLRFGAPPDLWLVRVGPPLSPVKPSR